MSSVFSEIVDDLVIAKDENGNVYWPMFGINTIGEIDKGKGYQTKVATNTILYLNGLKIPYNYQMNLSSYQDSFGHKDTL